MVPSRDPVGSRRSKNSCYNDHSFAVKSLKCMLIVLPAEWLSRIKIIVFGKFILTVKKPTYAVKIVLCYTDSGLVYRVNSASSILFPSSCQVSGRGQLCESDSEELNEKRQDKKTYLGINRDWGQRVSAVIYGFRIFGINTNFEFRFSASIWFWDSIVWAFRNIS